MNYTTPVPPPSSTSVILSQTDNNMSGDVNNAVQQITENVEPDYTSKYKAYYRIDYWKSYCNNLMQIHFRNF